MGLPVDASEELKLLRVTAGLIWLVPTGSLSRELSQLANWPENRQRGALLAFLAALTPTRRLLWPHEWY